MEKIEELRKRTVDILEKTRKQVNKYGNERKQVDKYFIESAKIDNLAEWEMFLKYFENIIMEENKDGN